MLVIPTALFFIALCFSLCGFKLSKRELSSPLVLFIVPFSIATFLSMLEWPKLEDMMDIRTFYCLILGWFFFAVGALFIQLFFPKNRSRKERNIEFVTVKNGKYLLILFFLLGVYLFYLFFVYRYGKSHGLSSLSKSISFVNEVRKQTSETYSIYSFSVPAYLKWGLRFANVLRYFCAFLVAEALVFKRKKTIKINFLTWFISFTSCFIDGSRGEAVSFLLITIIIFLILFYRSSKTGKLPVKSLVKLMVALVAGAISFFAVLPLLGRPDAFTNGLDWTLFTYFGAEIYNLNHAIIFDYPSSSLPFQMSFSMLYTWLANRLNYALPSTAGLPWVWSGEHLLGNVYTCFYSFYLDGGFLTVVLLSLFMGATSNGFYYLARYNYGKHSIIHVIIYSYIGQTLVLSFFGNRYFTAIASVDILYTYLIALIWYKLLFNSSNRTTRNLKKQNALSIYS